MTIEGGHDQSAFEKASEGRPQVLGRDFKPLLENADWHPVEIL